MNILLAKTDGNWELSMNTVDVLGLVSHQLVPNSPIEIALQKRERYSNTWSIVWINTVMAVYQVYIYIYIYGYNLL